MSFGFDQYSFSEITDPMRDDPCCSQSLQLADTPSPELFDEEWDNNEEVSGFVPPDEVTALFSSTHNTNPVISTRISTLSGFTDSTDSSYEIASSQYSFAITSASESDYFNPGFGRRSSANTEPQVFMPEFADPSLYIPPLHLAESHGIGDLNPNFLAGGSSTVTHQFESATCVDPAALTAHMISDTERQMTPFKLEGPHSPYSSTREHDPETHVGTHDYPNFIANDYSTTMQYVDPAAQSGHVISDSNAPQQMEQVKKPFQCPYCQFCSARKHNLKTHIETHDKEASKRFQCTICGRRFSRKHDLRRHGETIHGIPIPSSSSSSSTSSRRYHLRLDHPQHHGTTVTGDPRLMSSGSSLHRGPFPDTGLEDLVVGMQIEEGTPQT